MARWKLMTPHYLNCVVPNEWEYSEIDRATGRQRRVRVPIPRYLDIRDPGDWTNSWQSGTNVATSKLANEDGEIIVATPGTGQGRDVEFFGDPTPDMMPMDDEATAISKSFEDTWGYRPEGTTTSHSQSIVDQFQTEMADRESKPQAIEIPGLADLVNAMAKQSEILTAALSARRL